MKKKDSANMSKNKCKNLFISIEKVPSLLNADYGVDVDIGSVKTLVKARILPILVYNGLEFVLYENVKDLIFPLIYLSKPENRDLMMWKLFWQNMPLGIQLSQNTEVIIPGADVQIEPVFYAAITNLAFIARYKQEDTELDRIEMVYIQPTRLITISKMVTEEAKEQLSRVKKTEEGKASQFANSAYYMGSKRALRSFLVEAISSVLPKEGVMLDLMCGSGVASGAFNKIWRVFSSDAQEFCRLLALVQGGGFSKREAERLIDNILPIVRDHVADLMDCVKEFLEMENIIFHSDTKETLYQEYNEFINSFPLFPSGERKGKWAPVSLVKARKRNNNLRPYCLFTAYFANQYYGLRQCIEIDSLRYAIDHIENEIEKQWALGALIATLSALGTTHAAHFAQPIKFDYEKFPKILEKRAQSVIHDFCVRLISLARESERTSRMIDILPGPWEKTLEVLDQQSLDAPICVYVDAPYKREEYSRYYHLLETAVTYSYHSCVGRGRIPDKEKGERFQSEFFTRSINILQREFVKLFCEIINKNWMCAWSYSDSGDADIVEIVNDVHKATGCKTKIYATSHKHKPIGKKSARSAKEVTEYVIIFIPSAHTVENGFKSIIEGKSVV